MFFGSSECLSKYAVRVIIFLACISVVAALLLSHAGARRAEAPRGIVATVGNEMITAAQFEAISRIMPGTSLNASPAARATLVDQLVKVKAMAQEAKRLGLDRAPQTEAAVHFAVDQTLATAMRKHIIETSPVSEDVVRRFYNEHKGEFDMVEVRHILIRFKGSIIPVRPSRPELTREEALAHALTVHQKLQMGYDFAGLARSESDDIVTGACGGALGKVGRGQITPALETAAFGLPDGAISEPILTPYGYDIIQTLRHVNRPFVGVKEEIKSKIRALSVDARYADVVQHARIVVDKSYFNQTDGGTTICSTCAAGKYTLHTGGRFLPAVNWACVFRRRAGRKLVAALLLVDHAGTTGGRWCRLSCGPGAS